jgi:hypothetical protein
LRLRRLIRQRTGTARSTFGRKLIPFCVAGFEAENRFAFFHQIEAITGDRFSRLTLLFVPLIEQPKAPEYRRTPKLRGGNALQMT